MKVITLWQPWASWVILGWKTIETRLHPRFAGLVGERIGIHAGLNWDNSALESALPYLTNEQIKMTEDFLRIGGAIIGTAKVTEHRLLGANDSPGALIDCKHTKRYGIILKDVKGIAAIPARGKQGIWTYKEPPDA